MYIIDVTAFGPGGETFTQPDDRVSVVTLGTTPGTGKVVISRSTGILCDTAGVQATRVFAFLDQNQDGIVDGEAGSPHEGSYPAFVQFVPGTTPQSLPTRRVVSSSSYGRDALDQLVGTLVVVAFYSSCRHGDPQFVSAHFNVFDDFGQIRVEPVIMLAGDRATQTPREQSGAVLVGFDLRHDLDGTRIGATGRVEGNIISELVFSDLGTNALFTARVELEVDAPLEAR